MIYASPIPIHLVPNLLIVYVFTSSRNRKSGKKVVKNSTRDDMDRCLLSAKNTVDGNAIRVKTQIATRVESWREITLVLIKSWQGRSAER